jgi:GMP synthase-like glutamine amidotransferase
MRIHCLQHEKFEKPAYIGEWADTNRHPITFTYLYDPNYQFPELTSFDFLLILGGSMSTYEEHLYPFLKPEKEFIRKSADANKKILGICLGSQLLANVFGAKVYPNQDKEIGWFPIELTESGRTSPFFESIAHTNTVFHWHGDTFDLPDGAVHLAFSKGCKNQAYSIGENILALQFHLEVEDKSLDLMVKYGENELLPGNKYIQSKEEILSDRINVNENNTIMKQILDKFVQKQN